MSVCLFAGFLKNETSDCYKTRGNVRYISSQETSKRWRNNVTNYGFGRQLIFFPFCVLKQCRICSHGGDNEAGNEQPELVRSVFIFWNWWASGVNMASRLMARTKWRHPNVLLMTLGFSVSNKTWCRKSCRRECLSDISAYLVIADVKEICLSVCLSTCQEG